MAGSLITTTRRGNMRPLAMQGIFATDCYHQLRSLLEQRLGSAHARLFAEPVHDPAREHVDWHSSAEGTPTPLSALSPEQADAVRMRVGKMAAEIRAAAEEISKDADSRRALSGQLLLLCLQHPHEDDLWLVGEQPLVCCWGFAPGTMGAQPEDLTRLGPARSVPKAVAAPAPAAPVPVVAGAGCLAWLLPLLLLFALLWLILCRYGLMPLPNLCPPVFFGEDAGRLQAEREKGAQHLREIENLRADLLRHAQQCAPFPPPLPRKEPAPPSPVEPDVTPPAEPPRVEPFLGESAPPLSIEQDAPLVIPDDARQKNDLSFLDGCWRCETGLVNARTHKPVIVEYCFDKKGNGKRIVKEQDGSVCSGPAQVTFDRNGTLHIDTPEASCPDGRSYIPQIVECTGNGLAVACMGSAKRNSRSGDAWNAKFYRK